MGIAAYGESDTLTIGGRKLTAMNKLLILNTGTNGSTNKYGTFRLPNGTSGYQVPTGKVLKVLAIRTVGNYIIATNDALVSLYYADNDQGVGTSTAPTNAVARGGTSIISWIGMGAGLNAGDGASINKYEEALYFEVPAGKYLAGENLGGNQAKWHQVYCYLENV